MENRSSDRRALPPSATGARVKKQPGTACPREGLLALRKRAWRFILEPPGGPLGLPIALPVAVQIHSCPTRWPCRFTLGRADPLAGLRAQTLSSSPPAPAATALSRAPALARTSPARAPAAPRDSRPLPDMR